MDTGLFDSLWIDDEICCDGELELIQSLNGSDWLTRDMAIDVIKHLSKVFDIAIADAQE